VKTDKMTWSLRALSQPPGPGTNPRARGLRPTNGASDHVSASADPVHRMQLPGCDRGAKLVSHSPYGQHRGLGFRLSASHRGRLGPRLSETRLYALVHHLREAQERQIQLTQLGHAGHQRE